MEQYVTNVSICSFVLSYGTLRVANLQNMHSINSVGSDSLLSLHSTATLNESFPSPLPSGNTILRYYESLTFFKM